MSHLSLSLVVAVGLLLVVCISGASEPVARPSQQIKPGDTVVIAQEGVKLMLGEKVVAELRKGQQMKVAKVKGSWISGVVDLINGQSENGWVIRKQVTVHSASVPAAESKPSRTRVASLGTVATDGVVTVKLQTQGCELLLTRSYDPDKLQGPGHGYREIDMFGMRIVPFRPSLKDSRFVALRFRVPARDGKVLVPSLLLRDETGHTYYPIAYSAGPAPTNDFVFNNRGQEEWMSTKLSAWREGEDTIVIPDPSLRTRLSLGLIFEVPKSQSSLSLAKATK